MFLRCFSDWVIIPFDATETVVEEQIDSKL